MPSPVVLKVVFAAEGPAIKASSSAANAPEVKMIDGKTAIVTWPVDVWFSGSRTFQAVLDCGTRKIETITLDPGRRFPDHDATDNIWPRNK